jgi:membrane protease YdiL (CAAX protease family)
LWKSSVFLFLDFNAAIFAMSIIMGWICYKNRGSIFAGILLHFTINFFGEMLDLPERVMYIRTVVESAAALLIILGYLLNNLKKRGQADITGSSAA